MIRPLICHCPRTADELREADEAERGGLPYLIFRDHGCRATPPVRCRQHVVILSPARDRVTVGRTSGTDISLPYDAEVSRAHCVLERFGSEWRVSDRGLSRNGSFVNEVRVVDNRALEAGDALRVGGTILSFHVPVVAPSVSTVPADRGGPVEITAAQRRVLEALCAPFQTRHVIESTPTNRELADALFLREVTVKAHLRELYSAFGVAELPRTKRRVELVRRAFATGVIRRLSSAQR